MRLQNGTSATSILEAMFRFFTVRGPKTGPPLLVDVHDRPGIPSTRSISIHMFSHGFKSNVTSQSYAVKSAHNDTHRVAVRNAQGKSTCPTKKGPKQKEKHPGGKKGKKRRREKGGASSNEEADEGRPSSESHLAAVSTCTFPTNMKLSCVHDLALRAPRNHVSELSSAVWIWNRQEACYGMSVHT